MVAALEMGNQTGLYIIKEGCWKYLARAYTSSNLSFSDAGSQKSVLELNPSLLRRSTE